MFKKLKQKIAEESDGEPSPSRQSPRHRQVRFFESTRASAPVVEKCCGNS